jgi:hypothetical protein
MGLGTIFAAQFENFKRGNSKIPRESQQFANFGILKIGIWNLKIVIC